MNNIMSVFSSKKIIDFLIYLAITVFVTTLYFEDFSNSVINYFFILMMSLSFIMLFYVRFFLIKINYFKDFALLICALSFLPLITGVLFVIHF
jgi:pilus assembly protein TadC